MSLTVDLNQDQGIRVTDQRIETDPPDRIDFVIEGVLTASEELLREFEGASLQPAEIEMRAEESQPVRIDLSGEASLRLDAIGVGIATPDADDLSSAVDTINSTAAGNIELDDTRPDALAFTTEGTFNDVPAETIESTSDAAMTVSSITFAVDDPSGPTGDRPRTSSSISISSSLPSPFTATA